jgi:hypothetical protein
MSFKGMYPDSPQGNFKIVDSIGVPHPYMIVPKHVAIAADRHGGILGEAAIEDAENRGAKCGICKGQLKFKEHEQALLVECKVEPKEAENEIREWLKSIAPEGEKHGYAGFAFTKAKS